ncbi:DUF6916 family protein [Desulfoluna butyratoxydans]|uniref:DUF6916 domain-containing protein n=1 Tax=Desulfoluna butyratoxydans TaxID=231438 RepID=A0A4U8YVU5_9BACT|nr:hypothetical protein [Desulfoluna butyratoxydans]VFQ46102.1 hypothetical protein MSL71_37650 [Desulfoluna butyratoxydans]
MNSSKTVKELAELAHTDFAEGVEVSIHHPNGLIQGVLKEINPLRCSEESPGRKQPFSLLFQCDKASPAYQATVQLNLGEFCLEHVMITPVQGEEDSPYMFYEAVFN